MIENAVKNRHEFEQAGGGGEGKGSLACCIVYSCKESDTTEWLNNNQRIDGLRK